MNGRHFPGEVILEFLENRFHKENIKVAATPTKNLTLFRAFAFERMRGLPSDFFYI